jgi:hypothetical protein
MVWPLASPPDGATFCGSDTSEAARGADYIVQGCTEATCHVLSRMYSWTITWAQACAVAKSEHN